MIGLDTTVQEAYELHEVAGHVAVRAAVQEASRSGLGRFALAPQVVREFLHVVTDPRRFAQPLAFSEALSRVRFWWESSDVEVCFPNARSEGLVLQWMDAFKLGRKRILDTALACTYHASGIRLILRSSASSSSSLGRSPWARRPGVSHRPASRRGRRIGSAWLSRLCPRTPVLATGSERRGRRSARRPARPPRSRP